MTIKEWVRKLATQLDISQRQARRLLEAAQEQLDQCEDGYTDQDVYDMAAIMGRM
jgi:hypothetical protein